MFPTPRQPAIREGAARSTSTRRRSRTQTLRPEALIAQLGERPVLVLTDVFGATPCNVAQRLCGASIARLLAGVNLPMLLRRQHRRRVVDADGQRALAGMQGVMPVATAPQNQSRKVPHDQETDHHQIKLGTHAPGQAHQAGRQLPCEGVDEQRRAARQRQSIMGVMMLAAGIGSGVTVETDGRRSRRAMDALLA